MNLALKKEQPAYQLLVVCPGWEIDSIFNAYLPANVYFDTAGWRAIIYTPKVG